MYFYKKNDIFHKFEDFHDAFFTASNRMKPTDRPIQIWARHDYEPKIRLLTTILRKSYKIK